MIYVVVVAAAVVLAAAGLWAYRSNRHPTASAPAPAEPAVDETPMTGLESALAQVKDRSGRPIGERIEAEHVDDLRVPDDTGPLLRRALDHVRPADDDAAADAAAVAPDADDEPT
ncbi:MAG: hypothetical protein HKN41_08385 [Ilumatobacter sp.]|nr:hypothetical protein [Ilumatobacter sp.]